MVAKPPQVVPGTWGLVRNSVYFLTALLCALFVITVIYLSKDSVTLLPLNEPIPPVDGLAPPLDVQLVEDEALDDDWHLSNKEKCDLFEGKWVYDNKSYPLYKEYDCSLISDSLSCEKFGRLDLGYQFWKWQPYHCDIPRFNATEMLERLRNKRLVFVGDSIIRGQWLSMVCMVEKVIPPNLKTMTYNGPFMTFKAIEYNATIDSYWAPFLVESNSDEPKNLGNLERIVRVRAIEKHARHWTDADILVFDCYHWWRLPSMKLLWDSFEGTDGITKVVENPRCYEMALQTWADWLEIHVNRSKTQLFFMSMSSTHAWAEEWGGEKGQSCYGETEPISRQGYQGKGLNPAMMRVVESTILELKTRRGLNVQLLNITQLSEYRKDGHPSIYTKERDQLTEDQLSKPGSYADCFHWCLPGVPDSWNEILYAYIFGF